MNSVPYAFNIKDGSMYSKNGDIALSHDAFIITSDGNLDPGRVKKMIFENRDKLLKEDNSFEADSQEKYYTKLEDLLNSQDALRRQLGFKFMKKLDQLYKVHNRRNFVSNL